MATRQRPRIGANEKAEILRTQKCYVCAALGVDHAGFAGYEPSEVHMDHFATPFSNVGGDRPENAGVTLPLHAARNGVTVDDPDFEASVNRNCHAIKSNDFSSSEAFISVARARLAARTAKFVDDVGTNRGRNLNSNSTRLPVEWGEIQADFRDKKYDLISEDRNGERWQRFLVNLAARDLFTDRTSQVREASRKSLHKMLHTFMVEGFPMFSPVNARIDECGHVVIFDGNHRATSYGLAFGVEARMPVMIWRIAPGRGCAAIEQSTGKGATK